MKEGRCGNPQGVRKKERLEKSFHNGQSGHDSNDTHNQEHNFTTKAFNKNIIFYLLHIS
jgi:hypothetical protein